MKMYININKLLHIACFSMIGSLFAAEDISQYPIIELPFVEEEEIAVDPKGLGTISTLPAEITNLQTINELDYASILKLSQTSTSFRDLITTNPVVHKLIEEKKMLHYKNHFKNFSCNLVGFKILLMKPAKQKH